jgi:hypothetical protein
MAKRAYNRRSDDAIIEELQMKLQRVQARVEARDRPDAPILKEVTKLNRSLRRFTQVAADYGRDDLVNMVEAFGSGLGRAAEEGKPSRPARTTKATKKRSNKKRSKKKSS